MTLRLVVIVLFGTHLLFAEHSVEESSWVTVSIESEETIMVGKIYSVELPNRFFYKPYPQPFVFALPVSRNVEFFSDCGTDLLSESNLELFCSKFVDCVRELYHPEIIEDIKVDIVRLKGPSVVVHGSLRGLSPESPFKIVGISEDSRLSSVIMGLGGFERYAKGVVVIIRDNEARYLRYTESEDLEVQDGDTILVPW